MINNSDKEEIDLRDVEYRGKIQSYKRALKISLHALELKEKGVLSQDIACE